MCTTVQVCAEREVSWNTKLFKQGIYFQVTCVTVSSGRRKTIPVVLTISDLNDNGPTFKNAPYVVTIPEVQTQQGDRNMKVCTP